MTIRSSLDNSSVTVDTRRVRCKMCIMHIDDSPSDDFCSQECQEAWARARTVDALSPAELDMDARIVEAIRLDQERQRLNDLLVPLGIAVASRATCFRPSSR